MADDTDRQVAQGCGDPRESVGVSVGEVFAEGDVSNPVEAVLDEPVSVHESEQVLDTRVVGCEVGHVVAGLDTGCRHPGSRTLARR